MKFELPTVASQKSCKSMRAKLKPCFKALPVKLKPFPGAVVPLKDGKQLFIREARLDEVPKMLAYLKASSISTRTSMIS